MATIARSCAVDADEHQAPPAEARRLARGPHLADDAAADHIESCSGSSPPTNVSGRAPRSSASSMLIDDGAHRGFDRHRRGAERAARRIAHAHDDVLADAGADRVDGDEVADLVRRRVPEVGLDDEQLAPVERGVLLGRPDFADDAPEDHAATSVTRPVDAVDDRDDDVLERHRLADGQIAHARPVRDEHAGRPRPAPSRSIAVTRPPPASSTTSSFAPSRPAACLAPQTAPTTRPRRMRAIRRPSSCRASRRP